MEIEERAKAATSRLEELKGKARLTEAERKQLENEVASKRTQIDKWRSQQVLTKKNEEYQALAHEVSNAEKAIFKIEDQELDLMDRSEKLANEIKAEQQVLNDVNAQAQRQKETIGKREAAMKEEIGKPQGGMRNAFGRRGRVVLEPLPADHAASAGCGHRAGAARQLRRLPSPVASAGGASGETERGDGDLRAVRPDFILVGRI